MKIGIVTVTHQSDVLRPNGLELVTRLVDSLSCLNYKYECVVVDNASVIPIQIPAVNIIRVEDQTIYGLTGAWELGLKKLIDLNCDICIISNDDLYYNDTINEFINQINIHSDKLISVYGPLSNGILAGIQLAQKPNNIITELTGNQHNMVNGFMFAFTKEFYLNFKKTNGELFDKENYPWGGNEEEFQNRIWAAGGKSFVIGHSWFAHEKIRGWKQFKR